MTLRATEQPIDTGTAAGKAFLDMLGVFAEFEPNLRKERQVIAAAYAACTRAGSRKSMQQLFASSATGKSSALPRSHDGSALAAPASIACLGRRRRSHAYTPRVTTALSAALARVEQPRSLRARRRKVPALWRPHLALLRCLPDGRWFDEQAATWRDRRGRPARWPDLVEATRFRVTRVVLAAAHLDSDHQQSAEKSAGPLSALPHAARSAAPSGAALDHLPAASGIRRSLPRSISGIDRRTGIETASCHLRQVGRPFGKS